MLQLVATDFVSQFVEQRKRYHRVAIFHERLQVVIIRTIPNS